MCYEESIWTTSNETFNGYSFDAKIQQRFFPIHLIFDEPKWIKWIKLKKKNGDSSHFMGPLSSHEHNIWISKWRSNLHVIYCYLLGFSFVCKTTSHQNILFEYLMGGAEYVFRRKENWRYFNERTKTSFTIIINSSNNKPERKSTFTIQFTLSIKRKSWKFKISENIQIKKWCAS